MGVVRVHFLIDEFGKPSALEYQGHKVLLSEVKEVLEESTFPVECRGTDFDVRYTFKFDPKVDYGNTLVRFDPPSGFTVAVGLPPVMPDNAMSARQ